MKVDFTGAVGLGLNATCSQARIERATTGKGFDLVFTFKVDHVGVVLPAWQTSIDASDCKIEFLGIKVGSYCGMVERKARDSIAQAVLKVQTVSAPAISARLEQIIQTKIGSEVRIPLIHVPSEADSGSLTISV